MNAYRKPHGYPTDKPSAAFLEAYAAAHGHLPPPTHEETVAHWSRWVDDLARDDRKRDPGRQFELEAA